MKTYTYIIPFIILILFSTNKLFSQTYEIDAQNGQTISTCSGTFYDSGGQLGSYNSGENYSVTFCPSTTGTYIELGFSVWDVSPGASLQVFDGPDNTYNNFGTFSAGGFDPTTMGVVASPTNTSGCLTVEWTSGSGSDVGWEAAVSCVIPCQTVQSTLLSSNPPVNADGFIDICPGETVQFIGGGLYPENNLVYNQSNFTSSFYWDFGNGVVDSTSNIVNVLYDSISGYNVSLVVTDTMGCFSTNTLDVRVRVSTAPTFTGTIPEDSVICSGDNVTLFGEVQTTPFELTASLGLAGTTFLPDGSGASYTTSLNFTDFAPGQTLTNVNDLLSICAVMEHSYLGDLQISLECPNGSSVTLKTYPGCGGTFLGEPIDNDAILDPGVGYEYCWSPNPTYGTMNAECSSYSTMPAGTYASVTSFSNFIGCPLNGTWTIHITDNLLSDNGYIFSWGLNFDPSILPTNFNYEPNIVNTEWNLSPGILVQNNDSDVVVAPPAGYYNSTFTVSDDFGCDYDTTIGLEVLPTYIVNFPADTIMCHDDELPLDASNNGSNVGAEYAWFWDFYGPGDTISQNDNYTITKPGLFWVEIPNMAPECGHVDSIYVEYNELGLELGNDISDICNSSPVQLDVTTPSNGYGPVSYQWSTGAVIPVISANYSGVYSVSVTRGLCTETDQITVNYDTPVSLNLPQESFLCQGGTIILDAGVTGQDYLWSTGDQVQTTEVLSPGYYYLTVSNACGSVNDSTNVIQINEPVVDLGDDLFICTGTAYLLEANYTGNGPEPDYFWSTGQNTPVILATTQGFYSLTVTNQCGSGYDELYLTVESPLDVNLGNDTSICVGDTLVLTAGPEGLDYLWNTGETSNAIEVTSADSYVVEVANSCGSFNDFINISLDDLTVSLGNDTSLCPGSSLVLDPGMANVNYFWSDGSSGNTLELSQAGVYSLTISDIYGCQAEDEIELNVYTFNLDLGNDTTICEGNPLMLQASEGLSYEWSTGESSQNILVSQSGLYSVTVNHVCGQLNDEITIATNPSPVVNLGADTLYIEPGNTIDLDAGNAGATFNWSNNETTQTITVADEGVYYVTVSNSFNCSSVDSVTVLIRTGISGDNISGIRVFPNPVKDQFYLVSDNEKLERVELYNSIGALVQRRFSDQQSITVNTNFLPKGYYFLKVVLRNGKMGTIQLVKM